MRVTDQIHMDLALRLGRRNRGATAENPSVGCVVVAGEGGEGVVVGRGWTQAGGRPHAESMALAQAGSAAQGATAYVTLEPCSHHGQTPPCTDALIAAGIARVVAAVPDPDHRVSGAGFARLKKAGIVLDIGLGAKQARADLAGFLSRIELGRPFVTLKLAVSQDGKIAERPDTPSAVTGRQARMRGHLIRSRSDAILVGKGTVRADDPELTCRLPGLGAASPVRVVLDSKLETPPEVRLLKVPVRPPVWLCCREDVPDARRQVLERTGAVVIGLAVEHGRPDICALLRELAERGVNDLMVEGGAVVASAFLRADLVDRVALFRSAKLLGRDGLDALHDLSLDEITAGARFSLTSSEVVGEDMLDWYARKE